MFVLQDTPKSAIEAPGLRAEPLPGLEAARKASLGHAAADPVQLQATSQKPAEARTGPTAAMSVR